jgi:hypothetical protein
VKGTCPECGHRFARVKVYNKASSEVCGKCLAGKSKANDSKRFKTTDRKT